MAELIPVAPEIVPVPTYGWDKKKHILHDGFHGIGTEKDDDILYVAFIRGTQLEPLGKTFAQNFAVAASVFCSFPPTIDLIGLCRAKEIRVVSHEGLRADLFLPGWVLKRAVGEE